MERTKVVITEKQLQYLINKDIQSIIEGWKYYNNFEAYLKEHSEDTCQFCNFSPSKTGLSVDILLDDCENFFHDKHPLWVYFRNESTGGCFDLLPVLVHRFKPCLLVKKPYVSISNKELNEVFDFIKRNYYLIVEFANGRIEYDDVVDCLTDRVLLKEGLMLEMPTFKTYETNLPTDIWIDSERPKNHWHRIKFKDRNSNNTNNWASMTIDKFNPQIFNLDKKTILSNREIEDIKDFVKTNFETLLLAAQGKLQDRDEIEARLNVDRDIQTLFQDNNKINVSINIVSGMIYIVTDGEGKSGEYIKNLCADFPFTKNGEYAAQTPLAKYKGNQYEIKQKILNVLMKSGKKTEVKLNLMETVNLNHLDYFLKRMKENLND